MHFYNRRDKNLSETGKKAIKENLPAIKAIIKDRPELGKAKYQI